jgi:hypothetical protein
MQNLNTNIPDLKIEVMTEGADAGLLMLEQNSCGNIDRVVIHPIHVRHMAEKMGFIDASAPTARKTIATLTRRLLALEGRIVHMAYWLTNHSDSKHADLSYEQEYALATSDIAAEFCADFESEHDNVVAPTQSHTTSPAATAKTPGGKEVDSQQLSMAI